MLVPALYNHSQADLSHLPSKEAASYDAKHQKTLDKLIEEIRERLDFLGVDWVNNSDNDDEGQNSQAQNKSVRLLDYACGTGTGK